MSSPPRLRRALRCSAKALAFSLLGLLASVAILLLAINSPPVSGWVKARVNTALEPTLQGRLVLHRLGHLDLGGLSGAEIEVFDPAGRSVLRARGLDVRLSWPSVAWQALIERPEVLHVPLDRVALDELDVTLLDDGNGSPTLASAFEPRSTARAEASSGGTAIEVDELRVTATRVRGALAPIGPIEAELNELRATVASDPSGTRVVLDHLAIDARRLPHVRTLTGTLTADATLPAAPGPRAPSSAPTSRRDSNGSTGPSTTVYSLSPAPVRHLVAAFEGAIAGSGVTAGVELTGEQLAATFDMRRIAPATVTRMVPALAPSAPLALSADVDGGLGELTFEATLAQEAAEVRARGKLVRTGESSALNTSLTVSKLDLSRLLPEGAHTDLNLSADAALDFGARGGGGSYRVVAQTSSVDAKTLPRTLVDGSLNLPTDAPLVTRGRVQLDEPGAATRLDYDVRADGRGVLADVSSLTTVDDPPRLRELAGVRLSGEIASRAHLDTTADEVDAELRVNLVDLRHPSLKASRLDVAAHARGRASAPDLELLAHLTGVSAGPRTWSRLRVHALGTPDELNVEARAYGDAPDQVDLRAVIAPSSKRLVRSPVLRVKDSAGDLVLRAAGVDQSGERLTIERLTLEGPGRATASLSYGDELERLQLEVKQLDTARLLRILGVRSALTSAKLDLDAEFSNGPRPRGKLVANVTEIGLGRLRGGSASADLALSAGELSGKANVELARDVETSIVLDGVRAPFGDGPSPTLETLTGNIELRGDVDLAHLQPLLPLAGIERASGRVSVDIDVERKAGPKQAPGVRIELRSEELVLVSERPDVEPLQSADRAAETSPWTLRGVDLALDAAIENRRAQLDVHLFDRRGDVLALDANFSQLGDLTHPEAAFKHAPFTARLSVPRRDVEHWPPPLRPAEIHGALTLQLDAQGTLADPRVHARGRVDGLRAASDDPERRRVDVELAARYQRSGGGVMMTAHDNDEAVLGLDARWTGDLARAGEALGSPAAKSPVRADLTIELDEFPLELVPELNDKHVAGALSGEAKLRGLGEDARFSLELDSKRIAVNRLILNELRARVSASEDELMLEARVAGEGGHADVSASTAMRWKDHLLPALNRQQLRGAFTARDFPLASLSPLVEGSVSELAGKLDADLRAELESGPPRLSGQASLRDGVLQLPSVGQRFSDIGAKLTIAPNRVHLEQVTARGLSGGLEAEAEAELIGLKPVAARATLRIDEDDKLPLTVEGESVGDAWGVIETHYRVDEVRKQNLVTVSLRDFHVELPEAPPQGIQDLARSEHVRVGYWRQDREFVPIPLQPLEAPTPPSEYTTVVTVDLGELWLEKGTQVDLGVRGELQATLGRELDVTGRIESRRGSLDVSGRTFDIERATVTFTGGPPDRPIVSAVARYDSPAGYTIFAEYTGTATQGTLDLRSEPPLSQDEILTLLLFGTPDGSFGAGDDGSSDLSTVVSLAGGTAARGLNRALSRVTTLNVAARVDTSTGAPRPELVLQLTPRVTARVSQALGEPSPGQSPDRTFITLELRLASAWALSTMIGDRGATALDVIWRHRY